MVGHQCTATDRTQRRNAECSQFTNYSRPGRHVESLVTVSPLDPALPNAGRALSGLCAPSGGSTPAACRTSALPMSREISTKILVVSRLCPDSAASKSDHRYSRAFSTHLMTAPSTPSDRPFVSVVVLDALETRVKRPNCSEHNPHHDWAYVVRPMME